MTLEKLMGIPILKKVKPLYPINGLNEMEVDNIAVIEAPVENFPKERELILTTALTVSENPEDLKAFINEIFSLKVAGLIISLPGDDYLVLDQIKEDLAKNKLPIFVSPWELHFSNIIEAVYRELFADGNKESLTPGIPNEEFVYQIARAAIDICQAKNQTEEKIDDSTVSDEINKKIIQLLKAEDSIAKMAQYKLKPLMEYDSIKGMDLFNTLETFCETNYNISETARLLHLHRQSLLYRLGKIEELCGISHNNHEDLFLMDICIRCVREIP